MLTAAEIAQNMVTQLRLLDPSVSAEIGTPERKVIETVAEMIAGSQVDFAVLLQQHDLDAMTGGRLDAYLGNFGFGRQQPRSAVGMVTFSRSAPALAPITIPRGTQLIGTVDSSAFPNVTFITTETVVLSSDSTSVDAPVRCSTAGTIGNLPSNSITNFSGLKGINGITSVSNAQPTANGLDGEDDAAYKLRFKNTIFRNMTGTYDQILALAISSASVTKANVVGPISRYQEYIQIPSVTDAGTNEVQLVSVPDAVTAWKLEIRTPDAETNAVLATTVDLGNDTSAATVKTQLNAALGAITGFVSGADYFDVTGGTLSGGNRVYTITFKNSLGRRGMRPLTATALTGGVVTITADGTGGSVLGTGPTGVDAIQRTAVTGYDDNTGTAVDPFSWPFKATTLPSTNPYSKLAYLDNAFLTDGTLDPGTANFFRQGVDFAYNAKPVRGDAGSAFQATHIYAVGDVVVETGHIHVVTVAGTSAGSATWNNTTIGDLTVSGTVTFSYAGLNTTQYGVSAAYPFKPNVTLLIDQGADGAPVWPLGVESGSILLFEHQYMSKNSRNDYALGILNCVDVFVNGGDPVVVNSIEVVPGAGHDLQNSDNTKWTYQKTASPKVINFRRTIDGREAVAGNRVIPLNWQPVLALPSEIIIGQDKFLRANYYNPANGLYYAGRSGSGTTASPYVYSLLAHYCLVQEVNNFYGTVRARSGIEWFSNGGNANSGNFKEGIRTDGAGVQTYTGNKIIALEGQQFTLSGYTYDQNISALQALQVSHKQVTTDILVHAALRRFFKVYITVMYTPGATQAVVNAGINAALAAFYENQFYGAAIQLSDILQTVHNVPGVDNVRWTADQLHTNLSAWAASHAYVKGDVIRPTTANGYVYRCVTGGTSAGTEPTWPTVEGNPKTDGTVTWQTVTEMRVEEVNADGTSLATGTSYFTNDFFIEDRELATAPNEGVSVITKRAQNTWAQ